VGDISTITAVGGVGGALASGAYALKMLVEARVEARKNSADMRSTPVSDAATANAILLSALQEERAETQRLSRRVDELQEDNAELHAQIARQRRDYEAEIRELRGQIAEFAAKLENLQMRIQNDMGKS
jgi:chromosome segregation ATPase